MAQSPAADAPAAGLEPGIWQKDLAIQGFRGTLIVTALPARFLT
jgi:hypothetical protein